MDLLIFKSGFNRDAILNMNIMILKKTTQTANPGNNEKITVTHPFLPNYRQEYEFKSHIHRGPKPFVLCMDDNGNEVALPVEHTNLGKPRFRELEQDVVLFFAYNELLELRQIIDSIKNVSN